MTKKRMLSVCRKRKKEVEGRRWPFEGGGSREEERRSDGLGRRNSAAVTFPPTA